MSLRFSLAGNEILGKRDNQEDFYLMKSSLTGGGHDPAQDVEWAQIVLCDGMGGHASGEVASSQASIAFLRSLIMSEQEGEDTASALYASLNAANDEIARWIRDFPAAEGMGCTLIGARIDKGGIHWVSVGDSPLYLMRQGTLSQINADHSYVSVLRDRVAAGEMSANEIREHPQRNQLLSALVGGDMELIDLPPEPLNLVAGDQLIFATDGLQSLTDEEIAGHIAANDNPLDTERTAEILLAAVEQKGNQYQDNTAVVCLYCYAA